MSSTHTILYNHLLLLIIFISLSSHKAQEIESPIPHPSIKCDTCPAEPLAPPPLPPPPPPPPILECPPPPPPPCPPPPPPEEPPCISCMSKSPPPKFYNSPGNSNLYVTEYNYSSGTRVKAVMGIAIVFLVGVTLLEGITFF